MADSSDEEDGWCPRTQVGLEDLLDVQSKKPVLCSSNETNEVVQPVLFSSSTDDGKMSQQAEDAGAKRQLNAEPLDVPAVSDSVCPQPSEEGVQEEAAPYRTATGSGHGRAGSFSNLASRNESGRNEPAAGYGAVGAGTYSDAYSVDHSSFAFGGRLRQQVTGRPDDLVHAAEQDKVEGTALFQSGQYFNAYNVWKRSIDALESVGSGNLSQEGKRIFIALCSNAAQALLKCPEVEGAATEMAASMADKALAMDPSNTRALFRRGCAYANAQGWPLARKDFEQVLHLEPNNEAAKRELEKMEEDLPPAAPDALARRQEAAPLATVPKDPASAVKMAQKEAEKFRRDILAVADSKGCVADWCKRFNKIQVMTADWVKHQLKDPEILQDLLMLRGPLFQAMDEQQREDFLCAYDFVQEVRQKHQDEIDKLYKP